MSNFHLFSTLLILMSLGSVHVQSKLVTTDAIIHDGPGQIMAKQYFFNDLETALMPWFEAMEYCQSLGLEPARIDSAVENNIVARALNDNFQTSRVFWLGGTDWGQDGRFYWIRTGEEFRYNNFASGYPNGGLPESCVYVWGDGWWYDQFCSVREVRPLCQRVTRVDGVDAN